jgi:hypothetical protein
MINATLYDLAGAVLALSPSEYGKRLAQETQKRAKALKFSRVKPNCLAVAAASPNRCLNRDICMDLLRRDCRELDCKNRNRQAL